MLQLLMERPTFVTVSVEDDHNNNKNKCAPHTLSLKPPSTTSLSCCPLELLDFRAPDIQFLFLSLGLCEHMRKILDISLNVLFLCGLLIMTSNPISNIYTIMHHLH